MNIPDSGPWKRIERIGSSVLLECDCVDFMRTLPDGAFDLALVDPPYAVGAADGNFGRGGRKAIIHSGASAGYRKEMGAYANANNAPQADYFEQLFRVSKAQIIWGANYYPEYLSHGGWIVWDKDKTDGLLSEAELAYQSVDKLVRVLRHSWEGFRKDAGSFEPNVKSTIHPNQKPVRLYSWCLEKFAKNGFSILDTHLGSGSSAVAANAMGFQFVGCELDPAYYTSSCERITNAYRQQPMFDSYDEVTRSYEQCKLL